MDLGWIWDGSEVRDGSGMDLGSGSGWIWDGSGMDLRSGSGSGSGILKSGSGSGSGQDPRGTALRRRPATVPRRDPQGRHSGPFFYHYWNPLAKRY